MPGILLQPEVTVTGQMSPEQSLSPVSQTILTNDDIAVFDVASPVDLARRVPNFSTSDSGSGSFGDVMTVRGLTNTVFFGTPPVAMYVDDVPISQAFSFGRDIPGIETVEVLRGPQPYAVGSNAYGGLVNITTHKPQNTLEGEISTAAGSFDFLEARGWVTGPLVKDLLFFRLGGGYDSREGYLKNPDTGNRVDDEEHWGVYGGLYLRPAPGWEVNLTASLDNDRDGAPRLTSKLRDGFYEVRSGFEGRQNRDTDQQALRISYESDSWKFLSVTSRRRWLMSPLSLDADYQPAPDATFNVNGEQETWSQEIRWESNDASSPFQWSVGAFGSTGEITADNLRTLRSERRDITVTPLSLSITVPRLGRLALPTVEIVAVSDSEINTTQLTSHRLDEESAALFAGGSWSGWEPFTLHAGARVDWVRREIDRERTTDSDVDTLTTVEPVAPLIVNLPFPLRRQLIIPIPTPEAFRMQSQVHDQATPLQAENEWVHVTPTLGLDWKASPRVLAYVKSSFASKPGGYSAYADDARLFEFDPEKCWASEVGLKTLWFEGDLAVNLAGYYNRITDYQYERGLSLVDYIVLNADEAVTYGAEFETRWRTCQYLDLSGSLGYTHATFTDYSDPVTGASLNGNRIPYVPQWDAVIAADLHFDCGLFFRAEYLYTGNTSYDDRNRPEFSQDAYGTLNAAVGWRKGPLTLTLYGTNLAGEEYYTNINTTLQARAVGAPREYGVRMTLKF